MNKEQIAAKIAAGTPLTTEETAFAITNGLMAAPAATEHPLQAPFQGAAAPEVDVVGEVTQKYLIKNKINNVSWKQTTPNVDGRSFWIANFLLEDKETFCIIEGQLPKNAEGFHVNNVQQSKEFMGRQGEMIHKVGLMQANFKGWNIIQETLTFRERMEILKDVGVSFNLNMNEG